MKSALSSLLLVSLFEGKQKWVGFLIMIISPYFSEFFKNIKYKFYKWYYPTIVSVKFVKKFNSEGVSLNNNFNYDALCWYTISKHCTQQTSLICESTVDKKNEKVGRFYKKISIYIPEKSFEVKYNNQKIKINFKSSEKFKSIALYSNSMKTLTDFASHVRDLYFDNCFNNLDPNKIYVMEECPVSSRSIPFSFSEKEMVINKTYANVYLPSNLTKEIKTDIKNFKNGEEFYKKSGIPYKRGYLFYGPPGTGKTSMAYAISRENNMNMYKLQLNSAHITYRDSIKHVAQLIPYGSVVLIEEVDTQVYNDRVKPPTTNNKKEDPTAIKKDTTTKITTKEDKTPMSKLMDILDGYDTFHGCIVILTTNHKEFLDPALIRPGRVDMHYYFGPMVSKDIKKTIKQFSGYTIDVPNDLTMTSSTLINQILLPNGPLINTTTTDNKEKIQKLINNFTI